MKITRLEPIILHAPVTRGGIADSTHSITHWGAPGVAIHTECGHVGYGFSGTHAHLPSDRLIVDCITQSYGPLLIGEDALATRALWQKLYHHSEIYWVGRSGITHLALGAIDIALWDLKCKKLGVPLWHLLGASGKEKVQAYNTDGGWLNWSKQELVADCKRMVEEHGYRAVKIKVGGESGYQDMRRIEAVRHALGDEIQIMTDANGRWSVAEAIRYGSQLSQFDISWIEEPLRFDDIKGHRRLAQSISTPIALGEQLYLTEQFRDFIQADAVDFAQPDIVRLAGITEWWTVAELAYANNIPVVPHVGDMAQVHQHLCLAHPACNLLEYIPWLKDWMEHPAQVKDGYFVAPQAPGAGMQPSEYALNTINKI